VTGLEKLVNISAFKLKVFMWVGWAFQSTLYSVSAQWETIGFCHATQELNRITERGCSFCVSLSAGREAWRLMPVLNLSISIEIDPV
jgi:hypothetical protein